MMMIAPNSHAHKGGKEVGNADYGGVMHHVAPCVKVVDWGLGMKGLRMIATFWVGIPVSSGKTGIVSRCRHTAIGTPF